MQTMNRDNYLINSWTDPRWKNEKLDTSSADFSKLTWFGPLKKTLNAYNLTIFLEWFGASANATRGWDAICKIHNEIYHSLTQNLSVKLSKYVCTLRICWREWNVLFDDVSNVGDIRVMSFTRALFQCFNVNSMNSISSMLQCFPSAVQSVAYRFAQFLSLLNILWFTILKPRRFVAIHRRICKICLCFCLLDHKHTLIVTNGDSVQCSSNVWHKTYTVVTKLWTFLSVQVFCYRVFPAVAKVAEILDRFFNDFIRFFS